MPLRILLLNPPHPAIGSRIPVEQLPPLGLLSVGGPLLDAGFTVKLLDADLRNLSLQDVRHEVLAFAPDVLLVGHAGSTSAHPVVVRLLRALRPMLPGVPFVYGGVFPTYHWADILRDVPEVDIIVRGEAERTGVLLAQALASGGDLAGVRGLAFRQDGVPFATPSAEMILNLDEYRVGWELIDHARDADLLPLYRRAGVVRFLLGIESYDEATLKTIRKAATTREDQEAIRLLRQHGMIGMATYVVGFEDERDVDYWNSFRHLLRYDPDQIQLLYITPHAWTPFFDEVKHRHVIQTDQSQWDYKHQVLQSRFVPPWRVILWFKLMEVGVQLRPRMLRRMLTQRDPDWQHAMRWYYSVGRRVWFHEIAEFLRSFRRGTPGPTVDEFWSGTLSHTEEALQRPERRKAASTGV